MQIVRFFEDRGNPGGARRLLIGVGSCEESWQVDGGRREAVSVATTEDAERHPQAYATYFKSFAEHEEPSVPQARSAAPR